MKDKNDHNLSDFGLNFDFKTEDLYKIGSDYKHGYSRYFYWHEACEKLYKTKVEWDEVLPLRDPIELISSRKFTETVETSDKVHERYNPLYKYRTEPTGYMISNYIFISCNLMFISSDDISYKDTLNLFWLDEKGRITVNTYTEIGNYRNILHSQIERQANAVQDINREIADVFKVYYYETERAIVLAKLNEQSNEVIEQINKYWHNLKFGLRGLFRRIVQTGMSLKQYYGLIEFIKKNINDSSEAVDDLSSTSFLIEKTKYIPEDILNHIMCGFYALMEKKEPIIETSVLLAEKILPLESILEDFFRNRNVKSTEDFIDWFKSQRKVTMPEDRIKEKDIICRAIELKDQKKSVQYLYDYMRKWLLDGEGFTEITFKKNFRFGITDPLTFNRIINIKIKQLHLGYYD